METIQTTLQGVIQDVFGLDIKPELTRTDEQFGDYATNVAMQLAGRLRRAPREVAEELSVSLRGALGDQAADITIAGPGFINITLSDAALGAMATGALSSKPRDYEGKTVLVEYSDPNPFKPLHAGHLYTTLIGDMIARLVSVAGAQTVRLNYGGDVGLHVAKSMWAICRDLGGELPEKLAAVPEADRPAWLGANYAAGNTAYEDDEQAKAEIVAYNKRVYALHTDDDHDSPFAQIYWTCRQWSYDYFAVLYDQLQVVPFDRYIPESSVTPLGVRTVQEGLATGVFEESDGAVIFDGDKFGLHKRVFINSAGLPTYETKDVGLSLTKWTDYQFDKSIIITAVEQLQYMQVVIKAIEQIAPEPAQRTTHLTHGVVKLKGGIKMSSRRGNVVTALDILAAAREAGAATGTNPDEATILAAVKYAFAKNRIGGDTAYDPVESIALEGNSGPYLQYAHARARSIMGKATATPVEAVTDFDGGERSLARKISEYPDVMAHAVSDLMPHHICSYLYELAQTFNRFYENNQVVGNDREAVRLRLVSMYADVLQDGLQLLGITAPDRM
ncbi:MAG TPA: arginine--tRNA ligase [Candidatus Saccharimonadales bacterium]|nr:arginine--tRNA ligase [Candidatus Saccharimonadales bacterium]